MSPGGGGHLLSENHCAPTRLAIDMGGVPWEVENTGQSRGGVGGVEIRSGGGEILSLLCEAGGQRLRSTRGDFNSTTTRISVQNGPKNRLTCLCECWRDRLWGGIVLTSNLPLSPGAEWQWVTGGRALWPSTEGCYHVILLSRAPLQRTRAWSGALERTVTWANGFCCTSHFTGGLQRALQGPHRCTVCSRALL